MGKTDKRLLIFFLGCTLFANAQIGAVIGGAEIEIRPNEVKGLEPLSTKKLAFSITRNAASDSEKVFEIYKWIAENISYDHELMRNEQLQKQIYTSEENVVRAVLNRKKALCGGFSFLFKKLCADVGISAEAVHGYTKKYSGRITNRKTPDHTWNVVKLNGKWNLLDITWAIGHGTDGKADNFWYLVNPSEFILSHYPQDQKWTLLKNPISREKFLDLP